MSDKEEVRAAFIMLSKVERVLVDEMSADWNGIHHDKFASCISLIRSSREALAGVLLPGRVEEDDAVRHAAGEVFDYELRAKEWVATEWHGGDC